MVNITDKNNITDHSCLINVGDHSSITIPSAVYYKKAKAFPKAGVEAALALGVSLTVYEPCKPDLLHRIIAGAFASDDFTDANLDYLR